MTSVLLISDHPNRSGPLGEMIGQQLHYPLHSLPLSALEALSSGEIGRFDILIFDISPAALQSMTSEINAVRRFCPHMAILVLYPFGDDEAESYIAGTAADDMLARPVTCDRLRMTLLNLVRLQRLHMQENGQEGGMVSSGEVRPVLSITLTDEQGEIKRLREIEAEAISYALSFHRGRITKVARALGLGRSTLYRKMGEHALTPEAKAAGENAYSSRANQTTRPIIRVSATGRS